MYRFGRIFRHVLEEQTNIFSVIVLLKYGLSCLVTLILHVLVLLSADLLVLI